MSETLRSGESLELYDGEGRTDIWWRIILLGALISSILFYVLCGGLTYWTLQGLHESKGPVQAPIGLQQELGKLLTEFLNVNDLEDLELGVAKKHLGIVILLGIGIFIGTIGFSMIFSNFAYCLFRWNIVILLLVGVSTFAVMYMLFIPEDLESSLCVSFAATFVVITLKTLIFYFGRWSIVSWS